MKIISEISYAKRDKAYIKQAKLFLDDVKYLSFTIANNYHEKLIHISYFLECYNSNYELIEKSNNSILENINLLSGKESTVNSILIKDDVEFVKIVINYCLYADLFEDTNKQVFPIASIDFIESDMETMYVPKEKAKLSETTKAQKKEKTPANIVKHKALFYTTLVLQFYGLICFTYIYLRYYELPMYSRIFVIIFLLSFIFTAIYSFVRKKWIKILSFVFALISVIMWSIVIVWEIWGSNLYYV